MKNILCPSVVIWAILAVAGATAQTSRPILLSEETFDFGKVVEEDGPVTHDFIITNNSNRPITILSVKPSCGCTTPEWTREPILPGKSGIIKAQYDPAGRPGYFHKSLTVTTDADPQPLTLYIKGQVQSRAGTAYAEFPAVSGRWRLRSLSANLGKIYRKDEWTLRTLEFVNAGEKPITYLQRTDAPEWIRLDVHPKTVQPGQKGELRIQYNGLKKGAYGFHADRIVVHTDDEGLPLKEFTLYVTLEDYFAPLSPEQAALAPQLRLSSYLFDFGNVQTGRALTREVSLTNAGRAPLEIRAVQGNCSCVQASTDKSILKPGESGVINIIFNPEDRRGLQNKSVTIYSNDPQNPVQRIVFTATVN